LGDAVVKEGDIVAAGDILISGTVTMEPPEYSGMPNRYYQVHARGRVWARTWRTMTAEIPLTAEKKTYTGAEKSRWSLEVLGRRIKIGEIFGNSSISWSFYDKITSVCQTPLPWAETLPIVCRREIFREYEIQTVDIDLDAAQTLLEQQLSKQLEQVVGEDGEINTVQFSARVNDGLLQVTLLAECKEEIGTELPGATPLPESPNSEGAETPSS
jgi:similar to stage IV sporulation protein